MRLIDADELKKVLNSGGGVSTEININKKMSLGEIVDIVIQAYRRCLFAELEKTPTAYAADKVVEQLQHYPYSDQIGWLALSEVKTIVKAGGVNEQ